MAGEEDGCGMLCAGDGCGMPGEEDGSEDGAGGGGVGLRRGRRDTGNISHKSASRKKRLARSTHEVLRKPKNQL